MDNSNPRVGIYIRVSSQEQALEGYSIPAQKRLLELYCDSQGWKERTVYADPGLSAKDTNRPSLQRLKKDITAGKIDVLLVYRLDRLTRSVRDLFDILSFLDEHKCSFRSSTENYDTSTAMGRMFIGLVGLLAQWERENLGERVVMGMKEKILNKQEASGRQPFGYKIEDNKRVIDEEEKEIVLLMIELFKKHSSVSFVAKELNRIGIPTKEGRTGWSHQTVRQILRNPALCGTLLYSGESIEDSFEGILSKEEFHELSRQLEKQNIVRLKAPTRGLFSGMIKCPNCGYTLVKAGKRYRCNYCRERHGSYIAVNEDHMLEAFKKYVAHDLLIPNETTEAPKPKRSFQKEFERVEQKRIKYQQMYADDFMTYEELQKHMMDTKIELERLSQEQIEEEVEIVDMEEVKRFKWMFTENFDALTREEAITLLGLIIDEIRFSQKCVKFDKNGVPKKYEYKVESVKFKRV